MSHSTKRIFYVLLSFSFVNSYSFRNLCVFVLFVFTPFKISWLRAQYCIVRQQCSGDNRRCNDFIFFFFVFWKMIRVTQEFRKNLCVFVEFFSNVSFNFRFDGGWWFYEAFSIIFIENDVFDVELSAMFQTMPPSLLIVSTYRYKWL